MLQSFIKIAIRHISRNKGYVIINIIGLGLATACSMIAFVNWQSAEIADSFHEQSENIFMITENRLGSTRPVVDVSTAIVEKVIPNISEIKAGVRFDHWGVVVKNGENVFNERLTIADPNFFEVFSFPLLQGEAMDFKDPSKVFLSEKMAKKYFANKEIIGEILTINPGQKGERVLSVAGIIKDAPNITCLKFDFLTNINYATSGSRPDTLSKWQRRMDATFVLLNNPQNKEKAAARINEFIPQQNKIVSYNKAVRYNLLPLNKVFKHGERDYNNYELNGAITPSFYWGPGLMALMLLLAACLNFTNTTISFSNKRLKEMGVRKVMGSGRGQLIGQLLSESFLICFLGLLFGILLAEYLTPLYNQMWSMINLDLSLDYLSNSGLLLFMVGIVSITTIVGGAYPAFYISAFQPSNIFRGSTKFGGDNWLVRGLLGFQIAISLTAIIGGLAFAENAEFQKNFDLGYSNDGIINVRVDRGEGYSKFKNAIAENPAIKGITGSINNLNFGNWWWSLGELSDNRSVQVQLVGEDFFKVMKIALKEGRTFDKNKETDYYLRSKEEKATYIPSVIVNQKLLDEQKWKTGLDKQIVINDKTYKIIGVTENFYPSGFSNEPSAGAFIFYKPSSLRYIKVKTSAENLIATKQYLKDKWATVFPSKPFDSFYQDLAIGQMIEISNNVALIYLFLAIISIILAATGLYSLVSLNVLKRGKELAIRRVLGASPSGIVYTLNRHYLLIFVLGSFGGGLMGIWLTQTIIDSAFRVNQGVSFISIFLSIFGICLIGSGTIGWIMVNLLKRNPAETLKSE